MKSLLLRIGHAFGWFWEYTNQDNYAHKDKFIKPSERYK